VILGIILRDFWGIILRVRADGWSYPGASEASKILKNPQQRRMRIGELARTVDVNVETIRYYQRIGLVELPEKPYGSMRSYSDQDLQRLRFIRRAQQLGFSLEDIRQLLELSSSDCERVEELAAKKLSEVKAKLRQLRRIEWILAKTVQQCARRKSNEPCPIIETLSEMK
jgi:MerR family transcriptional regulator, mercuric resistance operon regulatory protein